MADSDPQRYRRLLLRSMALPAALALLLAGLLFWQVRALLAADRASAESDAVLADAVRVRQLLVDRETGVRGFLLTGEPVFLEPYHAAATRLPAVLDRLEGRVHDVPAQRSRLAELRERWRDWESVASEELRRHARGGDWLAWCGRARASAGWTACASCSTGW
ncbi:CHASE3 domain-containing protein [Myxococcus sp. 1LA]